MIKKSEVGRTCKPTFLYTSLTVCDTTVDVKLQKTISGKYDIDTNTADDDDPVIAKYIPKCSLRMKMVGAFAL